MRHLNALDKITSEIDTALRTLLVPKKRPFTRPTPNPTVVPTNLLTLQEKKHIAGLMRVNHAGEVCAQALYQGQALTAKSLVVREKMAQSAAEEVDHLAWCEERLSELGDKASVLNPLWYASSFLLGLIAGLAGDNISLGFVAETERQVGAHLTKHLGQIPEKDERTKAILMQMREDEAHHAQSAHVAGASELPDTIKYLMAKTAKLMTTSSYYL